MEYSYPAGKFGAAQHALMLPHSHGEVASITAAFRECDLGLKEISDADLDDNAREWVRTLKEHMSTAALGEQGATGELSDADRSGLWRMKAETLTEDQKFEFSQAVTELATWFDQRAR